MRSFRDHQQHMHRCSVSDHLLLLLDQLPMPQQQARTQAHPPSKHNHMCVERGVTPVCCPCCCPAAGLIKFTDVPAYGEQQLLWKGPRVTATRAHDVGAHT